MNYLLFTVFFVALLYFASIPAINFVFKKTSLIYDEESFSKDISCSCKGLAILVIMMAHIANNFGVRWFTPLGSLGVGVFLFLSGFGLEISAQKNRLKGFWAKRIKTAYLPYLIMELVGYIFLYNNYDFIDVVKDVFLIKPLHPYGWYMQCLFLYYIAFYISELISQKRKSLKYITLAIASVLIFFFLRSLFKQQLFTFFAGVLCGTYKEKAKLLIQKWKIFILTFVCGAGVLAVKQLQAVRNLPVLLYSFVEAVQVVALTIAFISAVHIVCKKISSVFMYSPLLLGAISYELYLIHAFFVPGNVSYIKILLFFIISIAICALVFLVKKYLFLLIRKVSRKN